MILLSSERLDPLDVGYIGRGKQAKRGDEKAGREGFVCISPHDPDIARLVEMCSGHASVELDIAMQIEAISDMFEIGENLGLRHITRVPMPVLQESFVERIAVDEALRIGERPGITVPVPCATHSTGLVERAHTKSQFVPELV
ncbi:hypothetical protein D9M73_97580 [compost metagenome]